MAVYFHGSFGLNREVLSKLVFLALENPGWRDAELAAPFGYGAPFGAKHRSWLHKTGLANVRLPLRLTPEGATVFEEDPPLESLTTQWFLHHQLTESPERAETWHFFAKEFIPQHSYFSREDLLEGLTEKLRPHSEKHFGAGSKLNRVISAKLLECYTAHHALGPLGLIKKDGKQYLTQPGVDVQGPWDSVDELRSSYGT